MKTRVCAVSSGIVAIGLLVGSSAAAQTPLAQVLPVMLGPSAMSIAPGTGGTHANDFTGDAQIVPAGFGFGFGSLEAVLTAANSSRGFEFNNALVEQITTFPIGSSSGGFIYGFDPAVGTFTRSTRSFGPSYSERPLTSGRKTLSVGFSVQNVEYDRFDGTAVDGDDIRFYYFHRDLVAACGSQYTTCAPPQLTPERSDVLETTVRLKIRNRTMLTTVTYGVTDRLDIGMTVPMVRTTLEARVDKQLLRLGTGSTPTVHSFDGLGSSATTSTGGGTSSGLGDLRFQAKYNVLRRQTFAAAALVDVRVPSGDSRELLGTGALFTRVGGAVATGNRVVSLHANGGATFASKNFETSDLIGEPGDELNFAGGVDASVHPRVTLSGDLLGRRRMSGTWKMGVAPRTLRYVTSTGGTVQTQTVQEFQFVDYADRYLMQAVVGGKISAWRTMLLVGNVLLPVTDAGLRNKPALSLGVEYTF